MAGQHKYTPFIANRKDRAIAVRDPPNNFKSNGALKGPAKKVTSGPVARYKRKQGKLCVV